MIRYWQSTKDGKWYFHIAGGNGNVIARCAQGYATSYNCIRAIEDVWHAFDPGVSMGAPVYTEEPELIEDPND